MQQTDKNKWLALGVAVTLLLVGLGYSQWLKRKVEPGFTTSSTPIEAPLIEAGDTPTVAISPATSRGQVLLKLDGNTISFEGLASGTMFFEASFPIQLQDQTGVVIAQGIAQAEGDWMTTESVPFKAKLTALGPISAPLSGTLVLQKDNPSGLPEHDLTVTFPALLEKI